MILEAGLEDRCKDAKDADEHVCSYRMAVEAASQRARGCHNLKGSIAQAIDHDSAIGVHVRKSVSLRSW